MQSLAWVENSSILGLLRLWVRVVVLMEHINLGPAIITARSKRQNLEIRSRRRIASQAIRDAGKAICLVLNSGFEILPIRHPTHATHATNPLAVDRGHVESGLHLVNAGLKRGLRGGWQIVERGRLKARGEGIEAYQSGVLDKVG